MMIALFAAVAVVTAAVVALTLESWWLLAAALVVHFVATLYVVASALDAPARPTRNRIR